MSSQKWYGCFVAEQVTLAGLYGWYASKKLDNFGAITVKFANASMLMAANQIINYK